MIKTKFRVAVRGLRERYREESQGASTVMVTFFFLSGGHMAVLLFIIH